MKEERRQHPNVIPIGEHPDYEDPESGPQRGRLMRLACELPGHVVRRLLAEAEREAARYM